MSVRTFGSYRHPNPSRWWDRARRPGRAIARSSERNATTPPRRPAPCRRAGEPTSGVSRRSEMQPLEAAADASGCSRRHGLRLGIWQCVGAVGCVLLILRLACHRQCDVELRAHHGSAPSRRRHLSAGWVWTKRILPLRRASVVGSANELLLLALLLKAYTGRASGLGPRSAAAGTQLAAGVAARTSPRAAAPAPT